MSPVHDTPESIEEAAARMWFKAEGGDMDELKAWLAADPRHQDAFAAIGGALTSFDEHSASPAILDERRRALQHAVRRRRRSAGDIDRRFALAALGLILAPLVTLPFYRRGQLYRTGTGERHTLTLDDGTVMTLDANTAVRARFDHGKRRLDLVNGRALFDVAKDETRPFIVTSANNSVTATGTEFTVERRAQLWSVLLAEGKVVVTTPHARRSLAPNQQLVATEDGEIKQVVSVDVGRGLGWREGRLFFENDSLSAVASRLNDYARPPLRVVDEAANLRVSGMFLAGRNEAFVTTISEYYPLDIERSPEATVIRMRPT